MSKNNCSFSDRTTTFNAMANSFYSPRKETLNDVFNGDNDELITKLVNPLISNSSCCCDCGSGNGFMTKVGNNKSVFVVDSNMNEIDKINLNTPDDSYDKDIVGLAYDPDLSKLYVAQNNKIFSVNNQGDFIKDEVNLDGTSNTSTTTITGGGMCPQTRTVTSSISSVDSPTNLSSLGIADNNLLTTYDKNGSTFLAKVTNNGNLVNEMHLDDFVEPSMILETSCGVHVLAKKSSTYDYVYTYDKNKSNCNKNNTCHIILNGECRVDIECPDLPCSLNGSLCEVVRSIALIETGIAKLITSESDKIKSAIENTHCNSELLEINNSVSKTIMNITMLEQILKEKLEIAIKLNEKNHHKKPCDGKC